MTLQTKNFDAANSLERGVFKKKPAIFAAEDLNIHAHILKNALNQINAKLGPIDLDDVDAFSTLSGSYNSSLGELTISATTSAKKILVNGTQVEIPATNVVEKFSVVNSNPLNERTFVIWLTATLQQLVSSVKSNPSSYKVFANADIKTDDAIASLTNSTLLGGSPVTQTLEGLDFVKYANPAIDILTQAGEVANVGSTQYLMPLATVVLEEDDSVTVYNHVDVDNHPRLEEIEALGKKLTVKDYVNQLLNQLDSAIVDLTLLLSGELADLKGSYLPSIYATLNKNNFSGLQANKVVVLDTQYLPTNPISLIGGGSINDVDQLTDQSITFTVSGAYADASDLALYLHTGNHFIVNYTRSGSGFNLKKIFCNPALNTTATGYRGLITIQLNFPNISPTVSIFPNPNNINPANTLNITLGSGITLPGLSQPLPHTMPLISKDTVKSVTIQGFFNGSNEFVIVSMNGLDTYSMLKTITEKQFKTETAITSANLTGGSGDIQIHGHVTALGNGLLNIAGYLDVESTPVGSNLIGTLPASWSPKNQEAQQMIVYEANSWDDNPGTFNPSLFRLTIKTNGQMSIYPLPASLAKLRFNLTYFVS